MPIDEHELNRPIQGVFPKSIGRPHIARQMVKKGYVKDIKEAFHKYLGDDKPCYIPGDYFSVADTLDVIHQAGGVAVLAHPHLIDKKRIVNQLRMFNFRHGLKKEMERPSTRYGSIPVDGPAEGVNIMEKWDWMVENYYTLMGWDPQTGKPLPKTLEKLGLGEIVNDL